MYVSISNFLTPQITWTSRIYTNYELPLIYRKDTHYNGFPGKPPGGWGFFSPLLTEASLEKKPTRFLFFCQK